MPKPFFFTLRQGEFKKEAVAWTAGPERRFSIGLRFRQAGCCSKAGGKPALRFLESTLTLGFLTMAWSGALFAAVPPNLELTYSERPLYTSQNLAGHAVAAECNPGGGTGCPCSEADVAVVPRADYGEVISNVRQTNTWVNAIGFKKFIEVFRDNSPVTLGQYRYGARVRLPVVPKASTAQRQNPQAIHLMIQLWDGRNALWTANKQTLEGAVYWNLNPWTTDYGRIKVYTHPLALADIGLMLTPDTNWHRFSLTVDFAARRYISVNIDDEAAEVGNVALAQVAQPGWGNEVALSLTTESMAAWPQANCAQVFTWATHFSDLSFSLVRQELAWDSMLGAGYQVQSSSNLLAWQDLGPPLSGNGTRFLYRGPFRGGKAAFYRVRLGD
ncbi:MAG: hypothetical protein AAB466_11710 [Verrucomicrobiota bacterium]